MKEPNQKDQIESVLADLAVQEVSERVPALFDHYIGFELIDRNDEGTRAAGLLGFGIGNALAYVPILFLNGRIRGVEMIYLKDHDLFRSLSKQTVDFIVNRNPAKMGTPDGRTPRGQVGLAQLQIFRTPQVGGKTASAPFTFGEHKLEDLIKTALYEDDCNLTDFFKRAGDPGLYRNFVKWAANEAPQVMEGVFRFYSPESLKIAEEEFNSVEDPSPELLTKAFPGFDWSDENKAWDEFVGSEDHRKWLQRSRAYMKAPEGQGHEPGETGAGYFQPGFMEKVLEWENAKNPKTAADLLGETQSDAEDSTPKLVVVTDPTSEEATLLGEEETVDLMQTGIGIVDNRSENSVLVREEGRQRIFNANDLGIYDMISASLEVNEVLIAPSPQPIENMGTALPGTLIYDPDTDTCHYEFCSSGNMETSRPPVMDADVDESKLQKICDKASGLGSVSVGRSYILINLDTKQVTAPVRVVNKAGKRFRAITERDVKWSIGCCDPRPVDSGVSCCGPENGVWIEEMTQDGPMKPFQSDEALFLPKTWKVLPLKKWSGDSEATPETGSDEPTLNVVPAKMSELNLAIASNHSGVKRASLEIADMNVIPLSVTKRNGDTVMSWRGTNGLFRKRASLIHALVAAVGLNQKEAREIAATVDEKSGFRGEVKVAYDSNIDIPWPDLDDSAGATAYSGTPQVRNLQAVQTGSIEQYDHQDVHDPDIADFDVQMRRQSGVADVVGRAAQSGIKQVFDPAMIAMLLRTNRVNVQVESEYLPILEKAVDRLCRLLLLFYWHNSEFSETYGQDDLAEFEDVVLSSIKTLGQLNLFLRQKAVGASNSGIDAFSEAM